MHWLGCQRLPVAVQQHAANLTVRLRCLQQHRERQLGWLLRRGRCAWRNRGGSASEHDQRPLVLRLLQGEGDQLRDVVLIQGRYDNVLLAVCHVRDREPGGWSTRKLNLMDNVTRPLVVRTKNRFAP